MLGPVFFSWPGSGLPFQLYTNACDLTMTGGVRFPGSINAPNAEFSLDVGNAIAGCVWASTLHVATRGGGGAAPGSIRTDCEVAAGGTQSTLACSDNATRYTWDGRGVRVLAATAASTVLYAGSEYEMVTDLASGTTTHKYYVKSPAGPVAVVVRTLDANGNRVGSDVTNYLLSDHLGSLDVAYTDSGQTIERRSYDAFGRRRPIPGIFTHCSSVSSCRCIPTFDHDCDGQPKVSTKLGDSPLAFTLREGCPCNPRELRQPGPRK
jgi:hypothetical protein